MDVVGMALEQTRVSRAVWRLEALWSPVLARYVGWVVTARDAAAAALPLAALERRDLWPLPEILPDQGATEGSRGNAGTVEANTGENTEERVEMDDTTENGNMEADANPNIEVVNKGDTEATIEKEVLQEVNFEEDVLVQETSNEVQEQGEVERVQERDAEGHLVSNDLADYTLAECKVCGSRTAMTNLRHHTRAAHDLPITQYKAQFGEVSPVERVLHRCGLCRQLLLLDSDAVATHLRSSGHTEISHRRYNERFMVDTRANRRRGKLEKGTVVRKLEAQLVKVKEPASTRATRRRGAKGRAGVLVKDEEKDADVAIMPKGSQKQFCCTLCDKKFKYRKMLKVHWFKCWPAHQKRIEEADANDQRKRKVEDKEIMDGTPVKRAKADIVSNKDERKGEEDFKLKMMVKVGDQNPVAVVFKLSTAQMVDLKQMKMSKVMKKLRKKFKMEDAVFLHQQLWVGEEEPVERFAGAEIQMV